MARPGAEFFLIVPPAFPKHKTVFPRKQIHSKLISISALFSVFLLFYAIFTEDTISDHTFQFEVHHTGLQSAA